MAVVNVRELGVDILLNQEADPRISRGIEFDPADALAWYEHHACLMRLPTGIDIDVVRFQVTDAMTANTIESALRTAVADRLVARGHTLGKLTYERLGKS